MAQLTAIEAQKKARGRFNIFLDGSFAFSLEGGVVAETGLAVGQNLTPAQIEGLTKADIVRRCANAALRYLNYRPRSEAELRTRLRQRGFDGAVIEEVIPRLKERGLVDDAAFAQFWKENRETFRPRSRRMLAREMRGKGVAPEVVEEILRSVDDYSSALEAARRRLRTWDKLEEKDRRRRLMGYLQRRGFSYEVIRRVLEQLPGNRESV